MAAAIDVLDDPGVACISARARTDGREHTLALPLEVRANRARSRCPSLGGLAGAGLEAACAGADLSKRGSFGAVKPILGS